MLLPITVIPTSKTRGGRKFKRSVGGFTVMELMIAVAILAVALAVGVPSYFSTIQNNRLATGASNLVVALSYARSEAIKRGDPVSVCSSADGASCAGSPAWGDGWIAFLDKNGTNGVVDSGADADEVLQTWPGIHGGLTLTTTRDFIQYLPNGMTRPATETAFHLLKPGCAGKYARLITVTLSGRVASQVQECPSTAD